MMQQSDVNIKIDWLSIFQFGFSLLGMIFLWGLAFFVVMIVLVNRLDNSLDQSGYEGFIMLAAGLFTCGLLLLPSAGYSFARFINYSLPSFPFRIGSKLLAPVILVLPFVLLIGHWLSNRSDIGWILLPIFHILALGLPILWVIYLGLRRLPSSSQQRRWGLFSVGLTLSSALILMIELFIMAFFIIVAVIWLTSNPKLLYELYRFSQALNDGLLNPQEVYSKILPYISQPAAYILAIAFTSIIVPLIEEAIKPLGLWFLKNRKLSPVEGFIAGLLCGAGYAMIENITLNYNSQDWVVSVIGRIGTSLIHMATTSLVGWALVCAWNQKKYLQLGAAFFLAVLIHGLWNGLAITYGFAALLGDHAPIVIARLGSAASSGLFVLAVTAFLLILLSNRHLQRQSFGFSNGSVNSIVQE